MFHRPLGPSHHRLGLGAFFLWMIPAVSAWLSQSDQSVARVLDKWGKARYHPCMAINADTKERSMEYERITIGKVKVGDRLYRKYFGKFIFMGVVETLPHWFNGYWWGGSMVDGPREEMALSGGNATSVYREVV